MRTHQRNPRNIKTIQGFTFVLGSSRVFQDALHELEIVAHHDVTVLIEGESGTGKELFCRMLHSLSPRRERSFVAVNCAALPSELLESELFGHRRGAYTHAYSEEGGLLAEAEGGTLFLDEISSLDLGLQSKLLRFLDRGEYRRVGDRQTRIADIRVVAACNTCLETQTQEGRFRTDLFYRLSRYPLKVPALQERPEDIPALVTHFLDKHSRGFSQPTPQISPEAMAALAASPWPGNVRELENVILRLVLRFPGKLIDVENLPDRRASRVSWEKPRLPDSGPSLLNTTFQKKKAEIVTVFERTYLCELLTRYRGNVSQAARAAGKHRRALTSLLNKHRLDPQRFR